MGIACDLPPEADCSQVEIVIEEIQKRPVDSGVRLSADELKGDLVAEFGEPLSKTDAEQIRVSMSHQYKIEDQKKNGDSFRIKLQRDFNSSEQECGTSANQQGLSSVICTLAAAGKIVYIDGRYQFSIEGADIRAFRNDPFIYGFLGQRQGFGAMFKVTVEFKEPS